MVKIAIHDTKNSFSQEWIKYCISNNIEHKIVCAYDSDIISQISDCEIFIWHHMHHNKQDVLFAKELLYSLELAGKIVFPNFKTNWFYDDKIAQKYLFESLNIDHVKTDIFYQKNKAISFLKNTNYPKVFKLRSGAGSLNVKLVLNKSQAIKYLNKMFYAGINRFDYRADFLESLSKFKSGSFSFKGLVYKFYKYVYDLLSPSQFKEFGYYYIQDFIKNNSFDIRVIVIGDKAFAIKRLNREGDFRASGSGKILYDKSEFNTSIIKKSFQINKLIKSQTIAFDFIMNNNKPILVEASFGFNRLGYYSCTGYWDKDLNWYEGEFNPYGWIIDNLLKDK
tara:strand:+ start:1352 stop:2362 length:1011 start_codon:yes stop_codon:yes gene_type:complete